MKKLSRRDFLKVGLAGTGTLVLGEILSACGKATTPIAPTSTATATPGNLPDLVVARGGEPEALVRSALSALGGMERFVSAGMNVVVKPNICMDIRTYEYAATTNPWVVGALVKLCFEAGAKSVKVFDFPFEGMEKIAYLVSGIGEQVKAAGGEMIPMPEFKFISTDLSLAKRLKKAAVFDEILNTDVLINVPIAKHHSVTRLTLGMKNLMGLVLDRGAMHEEIAQCIADLNTLIRPQLTVIDAVRILTARGPQGGLLSDVQKMDTVIASTDIVAADSYAASTLFGVPPSELKYLMTGAEMGLGRIDLENLRIEEIALG